jgi:hypothetical protein
MEVSTRLRNQNKFPAVASECAALARLASEPIGGSETGVKTSAQRDIPSDLIADEA